MTASIPNGFSSDDLERMLANAAQDITDAEPTGEGIYGKQGLTQDQLVALAEEVVDQSLQECSDPILHKVIVLTIIARFTEWHKAIAEKHIGENQLASAGAWMRDAGKFQAMMDILTSVSFGPDDFACNFDPKS